MTVTYRGSTTATGTTSVTVAAHASAAAADLSVAWVTVRNGTGSVSTPSGWTKLVEQQASGLTLRHYLFAAVGLSAGSSHTFTGTSTASIGAVVQCWIPGAGQLWDVAAYTVGEDTTSGTGVSVTGAAGIDVAAGDFVACGSSINANTTGTPVISGMSGATLGSTSAASLASVSSGSTQNTRGVYAEVTAGSSLSAPVVTYTAGTSVVAVGSFLRLRAYASDTTMDTQVALSSAVGFATEVTAGAVVEPPVAAARAVGFTVRILRDEISVDAQAGHARAVGFSTVVAGGAVVDNLAGMARAVGFTTKINIAPLDPAPPWQVLVRTSGWRAVMDAPRRMTSVRVDLIDESDRVVARFGGAQVLSLDGGLEDGGDIPIKRGVAAWQVQAVADDPVTRACSLTLTDPSFVPRPGAAADLFHPLGRRRARIWWLVWSGSQWWPVLLGTFHLDAPSIDVAGVMTVGGFDSVGLIKKALWRKPLSLGGVACHTAIQRILTARAPWVSYSISPTPFVLPTNYEVGSPGDDPWDDVERIQAASGLVVYADRSGQIVGELRDRERPIVADFAEGAGCTMTDLSRGLSLDGFANVVQVSSSHSSVDPPITAEAVNTDEASPGWVGLGYEFVHSESSDAITTQDQADALARYVLAERTALAETVQLTARADPVLDPLDLVTVSSSRAGAAGTYQVQAVAWSDDPLMSVEMAERRVQV